MAHCFGHAADNQPILFTSWKRSDALYFDRYKKLNIWMWIDIIGIKTTYQRSIISVTVTSWRILIGFPSDKAPTESRTSTANQIKINENRRSKERNETSSNIIQGWIVRGLAGGRSMTSRFHVRVQNQGRFVSVKLNIKRFFVSKPLYQSQASTKSTSIIVIKHHRHQTSSCLFRRKP